MKILAVIPARYGSTRFPGKPLTEINGKSMIMRVYEQALKVKSFTRVIVATDDDRIYEHVKSFGADVLMTAPTHQSGTDRCGEVIERVDEYYDLVVNVQGDEPFIQPEQLELLLTAFQNPETQIATLAKRITERSLINNPNVVKVVFGKNNEVIKFSRSPISMTENQHDIYFKHIGIYAFRSDILKEIVQLHQTTLEKAESLEQLRWLENGYSITVVETDLETIAIDTKEDLSKLNDAGR